MNNAKKQWAFIDADSVPGRYNLGCDRWIIEREGQRMLITQGYGGEHTLDGGQIRWKHGAAYQLRDGDTFQSLKGEYFNDIMDGLDAVLNGLDNSRPLLNWSGHVIEQVASNTTD